MLSSLGRAHFGAASLQLFRPRDCALHAAGKACSGRWLPLEWSRIAREPGPKRTGPVSSSSSSSSSSGSSTAIYIYDSTENKHVRALVGDQKSLASLLNSFGCGGGCLQDEETKDRITCARDLQPGKRYRGLLARRVEPMVSDVTVVICSSDGEKQEVHFRDLRQSDLRELLGHWDAPGLRCHPADKDVLRSVNHLQPGGTYFAVPMVVSMNKRQIAFLEGSENSRLKGCEEALQGALQQHVTAAYPGHPVKPLSWKLYVSTKGQHKLELDAAVVVIDARGKGRHILLVADHKQVCSEDALASVASKPIFIRARAPSSPDLSNDLQGVDDIKAFIGFDAFAAQTRAEQDVLLNLAKQAGIGVFKRTGGEYELL